MTFSIIIPTFNRAKTLLETLTSIYQIKDLRDCEVIVVDNGSTDDTALICNEFKIHKSSFKYFYDAEPGPLTGRHRGALKATGQILCFLDDDVELSPSWLAGVKDAFSDHSVQLATGPSIPRYEMTPPLWLEYFWEYLPKGGRACSWLSLLDLGNKKLEIHPNYVWGLNFCIRKKALIDLGGFHPDIVPGNLQIFQGDGETGLTLRAYRQNYKALYHPDIKVYHLVATRRLTVGYFEKRAFYQGVCNSFTDLKRKHGSGLMQYYLMPLRIIVRKLLRVFREGRSAKEKIVTKEINDLKAFLAKKEKEGYNFHQSAFSNDARVKDWVLRKDYWNYKLPV